MGQILQTISIIIAALAVAFSVTAWRRTELGKRRIELAEEAATLFYEIGPAINMIRSPVSWSTEGKSRERQKGESEAQAEARDRAHVVIERYNENAELFAKVHALRFRFRAYFGEEAYRPFSELDQVLREIIGATRRLARLWALDSSTMRPERVEEHDKRMFAAEAIIWQDSEEPDPLTPRIEKLIADMDRTCQAVINPRPTIGTLCNDWLSSARRFWLCCR
jgi:hypothetical protein